VARELGIDWRQLEGGGKSGRVRERDVRAAAPAATPGRLVALSPVRKVIAERLAAGLRQAVPVTLTTTADATNLINLRGQFKAASPEGEVPTYTDLLLKLVAAVLLKHPALNACWQGEQLLIAEAAHLGFAVDTEAGLLVPVLRDVQRLPLRQVAVQTQQLIAAARARRLKPEQMQGGTFTVTNLGMYGIDAFTPIINPPQVAVLGVGRIARAPAVHEDRVVVGDQMALSLTFDHRAVDGAPAARFLDALRRYIEQPAPWLVP
jgi:pyruvate dehydrogenase E2 component (dihydrolipoamide acetyltransferase)